GVKALALGTFLPDSLGLTEIDVAGQLAHDEDVQPRDHFGPERRGGSELRKDLRRTQVREQAERLAQSEDRLLRTLRARQLVVLRVADRAEKQRVCRLGERERFLR